GIRNTSDGYAVGIVNNTTAVPIWPRYLPLSVAIRVAAPLAAGCALTPAKRPTMPRRAASAATAAPQANWPTETRMASPVLESSPGHTIGRVSEWGLARGQGWTTAVLRGG